MNDSIDILRIIARDAHGLPSADRAAIAEAANEFEQTQRELAATQSALIEANAHRIAMHEALLERKRVEVEAKPMSMSSGWVKVTGWLT